MPDLKAEKIEDTNKIGEIKRYFSQDDSKWQPTVIQAVESYLDKQKPHANEDIVDQYYKERKRKKSKKRIARLVDFYTEPGIDKKQKKTRKDIATVMQYLADSFEIIEDKLKKDDKIYRIRFKMYFHDEKKVCF